MAETLTYNNLITQIPSYCERQDDKFLGQLPSFIMLAENRLATDMKQQGFQSVVSGTLTVGANGAVLAKPAFWRETISLTYKDPVNGWTPIRLRSLEYAKAFWPAVAQTQPPRYYSDYNISHFLLVPSPDLAYPFELCYYARLQPLDIDNQVNWMTQNAPQTLLYACLLEAQLWCKNEAKVALWKAQYDDQVQSIVTENAERVADRSEVVTRG